MKKILLLLIFGMCLCGCSTESKDDVVNDFVKTVDNLKSYKLEGVMEISNDEETFSYNLESYYLKDDSYKVILVNQTNNHEQIILKTKGDVYVITPSLNKSFKFQSEWPNNSSQAYLLGNLKNDIKNDAKKEINEKDNGYVIKTGVNYPNNEDLKYQKIYLNDKKCVEKVEVFNNNDIVKIKVTFNKVDLKANLDEKDFSLDKYIKENELKNTDVEQDCKGDASCENTTDKKPANDKNPTNESDTNKNDTDINNKENSPADTDGNATNDDSKKETASNNTQNTSIIENIIYPLYIPSNTYLTNSETIEGASGNRIILTFSGEKNFVLIEEASVAKKEMEVIQVYGEPLMLSETIGALSANSLSWDANNVSYYLASTELSVNEMLSIANSLGNTTLVNSVK